MGAGNTLRDLLDQDTLDRLAGGRPQTFDSGPTSMTVGPMGSSVAQLEAGSPAPPSPVAPGVVPAVDTTGRAAPDASLLPVEAVAPPRGLAFEANQTPPALGGPTGPRRIEPSNNPMLDAARQFQLDPSGLTPDQRLILVNAQGSGGPISQSVTTKSKQLNTPGLDKALADEAALQEKIAKRTEEIGRAQGESALRVAEQTHAYAGQLQERTADIQKTQAENDAKLTALSGHMEEQRAKYVRDVGKIDPNRLVHGKQALVGLAQAMGAFGATLGHTQNFAQQIIASKLEADLDAQKVALAAKRDDLSFAQQSYVNHASQFSNQLAAKRASMADSYDVLAAWMSEQATRVKGTEQEQGALNSADAWRLKGQEERTAALKLEAGTLQTQVTSATGGAGGKKMSPLDKIDRVAQSQILNDKAYGQGGFADDPNSPQARAQFKDVTAGLPAFANALKDLEKYKELNAGTNPFSRAVPFSKDAHEHATVQERLLRNIAMAGNKGALSENDVKSAERQITSGAYGDTALNDKADALIDSQGQAFLNQINSLSPAQRPAAMKRFESMVGPAYLKRLQAGTATQSGADRGAADGGRKVE